MKKCFITLTIAVLLIELSAFAIRLFVLDRYEQSVAPDLTKRRIICIGESTTADGYPRQLQHILDNKHANKYQVVNLAMPGVTTDYFRDSIDQIIDDYNPDLIIGMLGINDEFRLSQFISKQNRKWHEKSFIVKASYYLQDLLKPWEAKIKLAYNNLFYSLKILTGPITPTHASSKTTEQLLHEYDQYLKEVPFDRERRFERLALLIEHSSNAIDNDPIAEKYHSQLERDTLLFDTLGGDWHERLGISYIRPGFASFRPMVTNAKYIDIAQLHFEKSYANNALSHSGRTWLAKIYIKKGEKGRAEMLLSESIHNSDFSANMAYLHRSIAQTEGKSESLKQAETEVEFSMYSDSTIDNLSHIIETALSNNVKYIFMQYPLRTTRILKNKFPNSKQILFLENIHNFTQAARIHGFDHLFVDRFAGDTGHMTPEGQILVARSIVDALARDGWLDE